MAENIGSQEARDLVGNSAIFEIHIRQPTFRKKVNSRQFVQTLMPSAGVSYDVIYISKDLIDKGYLKALERQRSDVLKSIRSMSLPSAGIAFGNGQYLVPLSTAEYIKRLVEDYEKRRNSLLEQFEADYEYLKSKAKSKLGPLFDPLDYSDFSFIRAAYKVEYRFHSANVPEEFRKMSAELYQQERRRVNEVVENEVKYIRESLRSQFVELVDYFAANLGRDPETGKTIKVKETRVNEILEFLELFNNKNVLNDAEMGALVDKAKSALRGVGVRQLNSSEELRQHIEAQFNVIKSGIDDSTVAASRAIKTDSL